LRSGREHWAQTISVEVRKTGLRWSRLRFGREHWTWLLAVEAKEEGEEEEEAEEEGGKRLT